MTTARWAVPSGANTDSSPPGEVLTCDQINSWREQGFALVDGVFPTELMQRAVADAATVFPPPGSALAEEINDFGSQGKMQFPSFSSAANEMTLCPRLLSAVAQLLGVEMIDLRLTQSDLWPKYGRNARGGAPQGNSDQRIHVDYPNHTLTHPPPWDTPEAVEIIVYLSDIDHCDGATALVPRRGDDDPAYPWPIVGTPGVGDLEWINDRESAEAYVRERSPELARWREQLYVREVWARFRFGTVLFYRHDTWHRGTPLRAGTSRLSQNLTFRKAGSEWISVVQPGWAWAMYRPGQIAERLLARASVEQRCVLGFPRPGHPYWTPATVAAVGARFSALGMNMDPYETALDQSAAERRAGRN